MLPGPTIGRSNMRCREVEPAVSKGPIAKLSGWPSGTERKQQTADGFRFVFAAQKKSSSSANAVRKVRNSIEKAPVSEAMQMGRGGGPCKKGTELQQLSDSQYAMLLWSEARYVSFFFLPVALGNEHPGHIASSSPVWTSNG